MSNLMQPMTRRTVIQCAAALVISTPSTPIVSSEPQQTADCAEPLHKQRFRPVFVERR